MAIKEAPGMDPEDDCVEDDPDEEPGAELLLLLRR